MTTWAPISGTFPHFAARWVDPAFGFAIGWNYFYGNAYVLFFVLSILKCELNSFVGYSMSVPVEITAATLLLTYWDANVSFPNTIRLIVRI
jgi:yeast amino acid transporter